MQELVKKVDSYQELTKNFQNTLEHSVKGDGFVGVKVHLAEEVGFGVLPVWQDEAVSV
jgi:hypothetical protein